MAVHQKSSLAPERKLIAFELSEANGFRWLGHYDISIDDLHSGISREKKSDMTESLIVDCLSDGKYLQQTLLQKAKSLGIYKRVLDEAKKTLNVRSVKEGCQWYWQLPEKRVWRPVRLQHCKGAGLSQSCNVLFRKVCQCQV